ncbi:unnamed protein product [Prorocentrum cordatum]|nr:unnamed protein product [Polarella glacialis]
MREELSEYLSVGGTTVASAIGKVEAELERWQCGAYSHITRATSVTSGRIIHLETIFSQPCQSKPVPVAVALVHFFLDVATDDLTYQFEEEHVQHEVGGMSLAEGQFHGWLDRIIGDKLEVRRLHDLATPFERTRLVPPPEHRGEEAEEETEEPPAERERPPRELAPPGPLSRPVMRVVPPAGAEGEDDGGGLPLSSMLENIFDAADEEEELELTHKEVADLLYATPLGLADWDVKLLLTTATELETGKIQYKPFVKAAPAIVEALLKRRAAFEERTRGATPATMEAIELCYQEEIEEVARAARDAFVSRDTGGLGALPRHEFRTCLGQRGDRFSAQEVEMLMQMCKENDEGMVGYEDISSLLMQLRMDALHNAAVETDVQSLMIHLIRLCQKEGMGSDNILYIWELRNVLTRADQVCLSRMQIHVILMIIHPNESGEVDVEYFLRVCCTVIPYMFDTTAFGEMAAQIQKDKQDAIAKQELEELQGFAGSSMVNTKKRPEDELEQEDQQTNAPDKDSVEKDLMQKANADPFPTAGRLMNLLRSESLQHLQLSDAELRGLIAEIRFVSEADIVEQGKEKVRGDKIAFADHIKTWVPIMFELRKARIYEPVLTKDWGMDAGHLVDINALGARDWLRIDHSDDDARSERSTSSRLRRRPSWDKRPTRDRL